MKRVLITGANSGIGREIARELAKRGVELILHGRNGESLQQVVMDLSTKTRVSFVQADLASFDGTQEILRTLRDEAPDIVINSAGFGLYGDMLTHTQAELQAMIATNCAALVAINHTAARLWKERAVPGTIVNISSALSSMPAPGAAVYAATKAFVTSFSQALDVELEAYGIRVLTSCPGRVATNFAEHASRGNIKTSKPGFMLLDPKHVAQAIIKQFEDKKPYLVIDWKYRLLHCIRKLLPLRSAMKSLYARLKSRVVTYP